MSIILKTLEYKSEKYLEFKDITEDVEKIIDETRFQNGQVLIYSPHTTLSIVVNEKEKGICNDFAKILDKLIPQKDYYEHNDLSKRTENLVCEPGVSDCLNGHSHCQHMLMTTSETVPIMEGKMLLGMWQRIFAIELDCSRKRRVIVQVIGE